MSDGPPGLGRRHLLSAVAGAGAFSAVGGAATGAYLTDQEAASSRMSGGEVRISVDCEGSSCTETDGVLEFGFDDLEPGTRDEERFDLSIDGNPVRVWARTDCPPVVDPLGEALRVRLTVEVEGPDGETRNARLFPADGDGWGTLDEFRDALSDGLRLDDGDDPCLSREDDVQLRLEYELPEDVTWAADAVTALELELFAEQCRHVSEADVEDPFEDVDCPTLECPECVELGKVEVEDQRLELGLHEFDELEDPFDADGHRYRMEVLTETIKDEKPRETVCVAFRLLRDGDELDAPPICRVDVKGGPNTTTYDVDPPTTRTRGEVCPDERESGNGGKNEKESGDDGKTSQPAISHVVVYVCSDFAAGGDDR